MHYVSKCIASVILIICPSFVQTMEKDVEKPTASVESNKTSQSEVYEQFFDAVIANDPEGFERLLNQGADPLAKSKNRFITIPHLAAAMGRLKIFQLLVAHNRNIVNQRNEKGDLPIHRAALFGREETVIWLLREFPELLKEKSEGVLTVLHLAASKGHLRLVKSLIGDYDNLIWEKTKHGSTAALFAVEGDHKDVLQFLVKKYPTLLGEIGPAKASLLSSAACFGSKNVTRWLIDQDQDRILIRLKANGGFSPLHMAVKRGHADVALILMEGYADLDLIQERDSAGHNAIHLAAKDGQLSLLKLFARKYPELAEDGYLIEALAATHGHLAIIQWLLQKCPVLIEEVELVIDQKVSNQVAAKNSEKIAQWVRACRRMRAKEEYDITDLKEMCEADYPIDVEIVQKIFASLRQILRTFQRLSMHKNECIAVCQWLMAKLEDLSSERVSESAGIKKDKKLRKELGGEVMKLQECRKEIAHLFTEVKELIEKTEEKVRAEAKKKERREKEQQKKRAKEENADGPRPVRVNTEYSPDEETGGARQVKPENQYSASDEGTAPRDGSQQSLQDSGIASRSHAPSLIQKSDEEKLQTLAARKAEKKARKKHAVDAQKDEDVSPLSTASKRGAAGERKGAATSDSTSTKAESQQTDTESKKSESSSSNAAPARPPLLRTMSLALLGKDRFYDQLRYRRLTRQLSQSDLRKVSDIKFSDTDIISTLQELARNGSIDYEHKKNTLRATKKGDPRTVLIIHTHGEWYRNRDIVTEFLAFVHAVDPQFEEKSS